MSEKKKKKILFIEDEPDQIVMISLRLEKNGYEVISSMDGEEGLKMAVKEKPDLILVDVIMPGMNGADLSRKLTALDSGIKTLFMSGYTANIIGPHGILDEGVNFIQKPFALKVLASKLREVLER